MRAFCVQVYLRACVLKYIYEWLKLRMHIFDSGHAPSQRADFYTGGLSIHFLKKVEKAKKVKDGLETHITAGKSTGKVNFALDGTFKSTADSVSLPC